MKNRFNFKSSICTSREQSERLLALGLKKETADMCWYYDEEWEAVKFWRCYPHSGKFDDNEIPAWSLHRLIELMPVDVSCDNVSEYFTIGKDFFVGQYVTYGQLFWKEGTSIYDNIIDCIEWLIKEGYFNKKYLV